MRERDEEASRKLDSATETDEGGGRGAGPCGGGSGPCNRSDVKVVAAW